MCLLASCVLSCFAKHVSLFFLIPTSDAGSIGRYRPRIVSEVNSPPLRGDGWTAREADDTKRRPRNGRVRGRPVFRAIPREAPFRAPSVRILRSPPSPLRSLGCSSPRIVRRFKNGDIPQMPRGISPFFTNQNMFGPVDKRNPRFRQVK